MASKTDILNNLREYTSDQIAEAINAGIVTIYELSKSGNLTPLMRRRIEVAPEVAPTLDEEAPSVDTSSSEDEVEEEVVIPEVSDIVIPSEITLPQAPVITATAPPTLGAEQKDVLSVKESSSFSNKGMFKRPFSFNGRIRRLEYGISFIIYFVWLMIIEAAGNSPSLSQGAAIMLLISYIPMLWFLWAQNAKRCHDRGNSGWYQLIPFYFLVLLFGDGDEGENEYGDNPKE